MAALRIVDFAPGSTDAASGYAEVAPFNAERYADQWFEKTLCGRQ